MQSRDLSIDILRFFGLTFIILVHINPPTWLAEIRSFDVPLMVFVSGLTASGKVIDNYSNFLLRRTQRLVFPVWIFLFFYLTSFYLLQFKILPEQYLTWEMIWRSFLLLDKSIGYVWIIRVFLLIMLVTPLLVKMASFVNSVYGYMSIIFLLIFSQEVICMYIPLNSDTILGALFSEYFVFLLGYMPIFMIGLWIRNSKLSIINIIILSFFIIFILYSYLHCKYIGFLSISSSKYPPHGIFVVYGILVSSMLWYGKTLIVKLSLFKPLVFIGQNTIWIYLWHMPLVLISNYFIPHWYIKFPIVFFGSICIFYLQYMAVKKINIKLFNKYFVG